MSRRGGEKDAMAIDGMGNLVVLNETHMKVYCRNGDLLWVAPHNVSRGSEGLDARIARDAAWALEKQREREDEERRLVWPRDRDGVG